MMHKASDLIGKRIINSQTGNDLATVSDVVLDNAGHRIAALLIDGGLFGGERRAVLWPAVRALGDTVVVEGEAPVIEVRYDADLSELLKLNRRLSGTPIISEQTGERLGTVNEVYIDNDGYVVGFEVKTGLLSGSAGMISASEVRTVGRDAIITSATQLRALDDDDMQRYPAHTPGESLLDSSAAAATPGSQRPMGANVPHTRDIDRGSGDTLGLEPEAGVEPYQTRQLGSVDATYSAGVGSAPSGLPRDVDELPAAPERSYSPGLGAGVEPPGPLDPALDGSRSLDIDPNPRADLGRDRAIDPVDLDLDPGPDLDIDRERGSGIDPDYNRGPRL